MFGRAKIANQKFPLLIIDENVLGFHVAVGDPFFPQVEQSSEHLIGENLHFEGRDLLASLTANHFIKVGWKVVHHDVQVLLLSLISVERIPDFQNIRVVEGLKNF